MPRLYTLTWTAALVLAATAPLTTQAQPAADFVHQAFAHGVPYEEALKYRSADNQRQLLSMLDNSAEQPAWANIVSLLGIIGDGNASLALQNFVRGGEGQLTVADYNARTAAVFSLGYVLYRLKDAGTRVYLEEGARPATWSDRVHWRSPFSESPDRRNVQLTLAAVRALGVSGEPGLQVLQKLAGADMTALEPTSRNAMTATVRDALEANDKVQKLGLSQFLRQQQNRD